MRPRQVFRAYDDRAVQAGGQLSYCPDCGSSLPDAKGCGRQSRCRACGSVHYTNPYPGVVVLVEMEGNVLLGKRAAGAFAGGKWCLPGGFVEFGEDFLSAAVREVKEETGLDVKITSIINVVSNFLSPRLHTLVVVLLANVLGGTSVAGDDLVELKWFTGTEALPELAFEADKYILEYYQRNRPTGLPVQPT